MDNVLQQIEVDMTNAESDEQLLSCLNRLQKIEEKFNLVFGPFNLELHKLRGKLLTVQLLLSKLYYKCLHYAFVTQTTEHI